MSTGESNPGAALNEAQLAADAGITIHCVGVGSDADMDLLTTIATITGGDVVQVDLLMTPEEYQEALESIFSTVSLRRVHSRLIIQ